MIHSERKTGKLRAFYKGKKKNTSRISLGWGEESNEMQRSLKGIVHAVKKTPRAEEEKGESTDGGSIGEG